MPKKRKRKGFVSEKQRRAVFAILTMGSVLGLATTAAVGKTRALKNLGGTRATSFSRRRAAFNTTFRLGN